MKYQFFFNKAELLRHKISIEDIHHLDKNTKAVTKLKTPKTIRG